MYSDISENFQNPVPHSLTKQKFVMSKICYVFFLIYFTGFGDGITKRDYRVILMMAVMLTVAGLSYWYVSRKGKMESVVYSYYKERGSLMQRDALRGLRYFAGSFVLFLGYVIIDYIVKGSH